MATQAAGSQLLGDLLKIVQTPFSPTFIRKFLSVPEDQRTSLILQLCSEIDIFIFRANMTNNIADMISALPQASSNSLSLVSTQSNQQYSAPQNLLQARDYLEKYNQLLFNSDQNSLNFPQTNSAPVPEQVEQQVNVDVPSPIPVDEEKEENLPEETNPFLESMAKMTSETVEKADNSKPLTKYSYLLAPPPQPPKVTSFNAEDATGDVMRNFAKKPRQFFTRQPISNFLEEGLGKRVGPSKLNQPQCEELVDVETVGSEAKGSEAYLHPDYLDIEADPSKFTSRKIMTPDNKRTTRIMPYMQTNSEKHQRTADRTKRYVCEYCPDYAVNGASTLNVHLKKFHNDGPVKNCRKCGYWYSNAARLAEHVPKCETNSLQRVKVTVAKTQELLAPADQGYSTSRRNVALPADLKRRV